MPKWTCSSCNATMTVKPEHVGTVKRCLSCDAESTVTDDATPVRLTPHPPIDRLSWLANRLPGTGTVGARAYICLLFGLSVLAIIRTDNDTTRGFALMNAAGLFSLLAVSWPLYVLVDDVRAIRRLHENIKQE